MLFSIEKSCTALFLYYLFTFQPFLTFFFFISGVTGAQFTYRYVFCHKIKHKQWIMLKDDQMIFIDINNIEMWMTKFKQNRCLWVITPYNKHTGSDGSRDYIQYSLDLLIAYPRSLLSFPGEAKTAIRRFQNFYCLFVINWTRKITLQLTVKIFLTVN